MPTEFGGGLTYEKEGFVVVYHCLQAYIGSKGGIERVSPQIKWIQNAYQSLKAKYPEWENDILASQRTNDRSRAFLEELHAYWEDTTAYFVNLQRTHKTYPKLSSTTTSCALTSAAQFDFTKMPLYVSEWAKDVSTSDYGPLGSLRECIYTSTIFPTSSRI
jgi:hypothetical protein